MRGIGPEAAMDAILTMAPFPFDNIDGRTNFVIAGTEATFTFTWLQMSRSDTNSKSMGEASMTPTLFTKNHTKNKR